MSFISTLSTAPTPVLATGGVLALLVCIFIAVFLIPGLLHLRKLKDLQQQIDKLGPQNVANEFKKLFAKDQRLAHLWKEYQDSLHTQHEERDGQMTTLAVRATVPAEVYFNSQYVVDSRLRTEFFKHLPGLFTGIGIIGTFTGLIDGLKSFQVSENAAIVRTMLAALMHTVGEAFLISAAAITSAMVVTFLEKLLLSSLYRRTEEIAHAIDARFDSGAGEEYLSRLVKSSEESASQSKILKDALVGELGDLLRELTSAQISASRAQQEHLAERLTETSRIQVEAARQDNQALGATIAESIQQSLQGPLQDIAKIVNQASGDQSASAGKMLQDVMTSFSQRLNDLFGGQITGLSDLNKQTAQSIQDAVSTLQVLVTNMEESSRRSTDTMAERMAQAIEKMEARQEAMNAESHTFVDQIRQLVASSQAETSTKLQATLEALGTQVAGMLATLTESQKQVFEGNRSREESMNDRARTAVTAMSDSVGGALKEMSIASVQLSENVAAMTTNTEESSRRATDAMAVRMAQAIDQIGVRQEAMNTQSQAFVDQVRQMAATSQSETNKKLQSTLETIGTQVATMLTTLNESQTQVFEDNRSREQSMTDRARTAVTAMSESVEGAIKEMSAASAQMAQNVAILTQTTTTSIDKMNAGADQLNLASHNFATAGERVSNVMGQAANVSAKLVETSASLTKGGAALQELLRDYQAQRDAVGLLVKELRTTVELARKEASLTGDILSRIEGSAERLGSAQKKADEYLAGVSRVLGDAHTSFATEVKRTLNTANTEFHTKLTSAVGMLSSAVGELELTLAAMGTLAPVRR